MILGRQKRKMKWAFKWLSHLFYTAVTRAQNMVILVGREDVARTMVENHRQSMRYTGLAHRLRDGG